MALTNFKLYSGVTAAGLISLYLGLRYMKRTSLDKADQHVPGTSNVMVVHDKYAFGDAMAIGEDAFRPRPA